MTSTSEAVVNIPAAIEKKDILVLDAVSGGYGRFDVIHDISMHVEKGEAVALLGPNGAGKTTIMRAILNSLRQRRGNVSVDGIDVSKLPTHKIVRGHVSLVPEGRRLFAEQSVEDNLRLGALWIKNDSERIESLLSSVFNIFPVVEKYRKRPATALSGGEQQMVAVGRMMMSDPKVMLLDEPSLGLAPLAIEDMLRGLMALREQGRSILLVEQRVDLALKLCDRVYVLSGGRIVAHDEASKFDDDGRALIEAYLG
jgi:branched-chain amino acid transport system ATP-binding protein